ncbi:penicillin-binding protein activator [Shewanella sp. AS1]|uniref:penicillin-binding protein activator n=1 Tax=Shewanella sp. AS1 TaxID=2907626 RepID=UPI001F18F50D|nr:penicillin-binding protein activator [Shewanella sp. AS1]MCE9680233.1 penicillin-binding protein activator [Shewanella sp. AS1]
MLKRLNTTKFIMFALLSAVLFGCATPSEPKKPQAQAVSLVSATEAPSQYLSEAAKAETDEQRDRYLLLAAHAFINQGDSFSAGQTLTSMKDSMVQRPELLAEHKYLTARVLEMTSNYDDALAQLDYPLQWRMADWQWVSYYQLKARLYQLTQQPIEQARQLSLLSAYLPAEQASEVNDEIWSILQPLQEETLEIFSQDKSNPIFAGWLQLAYIAKHYAIDPQVLVQRLGDWQHENPQHPGALKLPTDLERALNTKPYKPKNIAVLLPLSGSRAAVANPVKQGIISSYLAQHNASVSINFFDTAQGATLAYQQAVEAGAEFIIGPLLPSEVEQLMQAQANAEQAPLTPNESTLTQATQASALPQPQQEGLAQPAMAQQDLAQQELTQQSVGQPELAQQHLATQEAQAQARSLAALQMAIPQLYLNSSHDNSHREEQFFFALSPTDEAIDAAQKMFNDGIRKPLLLASSDSTGKRMAEAFNQKWQELAQEDAEVHYYNGGNEMKVAVQKSLGVVDSYERIARIKALLGNDIQADFRSRRDIDAIYMVSSNHDLPLLKPFVDVSFSVFAQPVPLYTTSRSRIETHSRAAAQELNKLSISDMPWLLQSNEETAEVAKLWPTWTNSQKRLYIMGFDAVELIGKLAQMRALPGYQYSGRSGLLSVSSDGTINRQLSWGRYQYGSLKPL